MFDDLAEIKFSTEQTSPLQKLCEAGSEYGLRILKKTVSSELSSLLCPRATQRIKNHLRQILVETTRPCLALELEAFRCAHKAIYSQKGSSITEIERKFLGKRPYDRLIAMFKKFPVLGKLWCRLIGQWCDSVSEFLDRVDADKQQISCMFFCGKPVGEIIDLRAGLSDPHNKGRTVMRIQFRAGLLMYKPRPGDGELEWLRFISYLNASSFRPKLNAARVMGRGDYCWMQEVEFKPCKHQAAAHRFYKRLGGMVAGAYLLKAVDCHRDNIIACGEHPVLVDAEALWHVEEEKKTDVLDPLYGTGFLPSSNRRSSYQYRSSTLSRTGPGKHSPYLGVKPLGAYCYEDAIVSGFCQAWRCLVGTAERRAAFARYLHRIRRGRWRRLYRSTAEYDRILRASVRPAVMRSGVNRNRFIARSCKRTAVPKSVIREEINALKRLDIPYFSRRSTATSLLQERNEAPAEVINAVRRALHL
jgi:lantibiotic modifying enzyme